MLALASQIFICLLIAALIGMIIGYLLGKMNCKDKNTQSHIIQKEDDCGKKKSQSSEKEDLESKDEQKDSQKVEEDTTLPPAGLVSTDSNRVEEEKNSKTEDESNRVKEEEQTSTEIAESDSTPKSKEDGKTKEASSGSLITTPTALLGETPEKKESKSTEKKISIAPKGLDAPRDGKKDDLVRIKGIGLKIEEKLNSLGIYHYDQIANWTKEEINWVNSFLHFSGRIEREDWITQAKALARGEETEFAKRVDAGKVPSSKKS
jgi:predicted flap endonuclease-1-like 5' DNA nuclease